MSEKLVLVVLAVTVVSALLNIAHMITGAVYLGKYDGLTNECVGGQKVWGWCLMSILYTGLSGIGFFTATGNSEEDKNRRTRNMKFSGAVALALLIWGAVIWANIDAPCKAMYQTQASDLWNFYAVTFWYIVAAECVMFTVFCCGVCAVVASGGSGQSRV